MTWTNITTTTTISASRAVTLPARLMSEPIKILALHPGTGIGGTLTIWDENGTSAQVTRLDANSTRYEAEFYSDVDGFNFSFAADGNGALAAPGVSVYLTSRSAPDPNIVDGSISMSGPIETPNLVPSWASFHDQMVGSAKNVCHAWGSSTFQYSTETTAAKKWYSDSLLFAAWARHGCPMILGYNGGVGGTTTSQIKTKFLAEVSSTAHDVDMLLLGSNDLGIDVGSTFAAIKADIDTCVSTSLKAGHRLLLVTPHMQLNPGDWNEYKKLSEYYKTLVARWPGRVFLADVWELLNGAGQATPADYLDTLEKHFNQKGAWAAAPAFEKPFRQMFGEMAFTDLAGAGIGESIVTPADPPTGFSNSGSTVTVSTGTVDSAGRSRTRLTVTANGAGFWYKTTTALELGATYRPVADVEVISVGQADTAASCGVFLRSEDSTINHSFGNTAREDVNMQPVGTRMRLVGPEFVATAAAVTGSRIGLAIGGPNTVVDVATLAIVKTKAA